MSVIAISSHSVVQQEHRTVHRLPNSALKLSMKPSAHRKAETCFASHCMKFGEDCACESVPIRSEGDRCCQRPNKLPAWSGKPVWDTSIPLGRVDTVCRDQNHVPREERAGLADGRYLQRRVRSLRLARPRCPRCSSGTCPKLSWACGGPQGPVCTKLAVSAKI